MSDNALCLNCKSAEHRIFVKAADIAGKQHIFLKCSGCGLVFLWPQPDESMLESMYGPEYYGEDQEEKFRNGLIVKGINYFAVRRARRFAMHIERGARVMDVGCGNGRFLEHLSEMKMQFELNGIEIQPKAALRASSRLRERAWIHTVTDIEKFFGKQSFNAVSYIHVFEHLPDPAGTMDQMSEIIRPGGTVMIVIPNIASLQAKEYKHKWFHLDPPRHLHFYPPQLLINEMLKRGFHSVSVRYFDPEQNPYGELQSMLNVLLKKRDVLFERLKGNYKYAPEYGKFSIFMMKLFFIMLMPLCLLLDIIAAKRKNSATVEIIFRKAIDEEQV